MKVGSRNAITSADEAQAFVRRRYRELNYGLGWSYLYSRQLALSSAKLVTMGLNPGGGDPNLTWTEEWSYEDGDNAYFDQPWRNNEHFTPLQQQIQALAKIHFSELNKSQIASFQYIPFRSPSWNKLTRRIEAIEVGDRLFEWLWPQLNPEFVVCFGMDPLLNHIVDKIGATFDASFSTGWGATRAKKFVFGEGRRLVSLPHLSRYQVIGRPQFAEAPEVFARS